GDENDETQEVELVLCRARDGDVSEMRRVERTPEEPYSHSSTSSPTSISSPSRAPAAFRIASSSAGAGGRPTTRKPRSVRNTRYPRRARSEEHTSELQSRGHLVCRLLL